MTKRTFSKSHRIVRPANQRPPSRHQDTNKTPVFILGGFVLVLAIIGVIGALWSIAPSEADDAVSANLTQVATATSTPTPFPIVDVELSRRQLLASLQRWTDTQSVEIGCIAGVCNQRIYLSLTLLTPELLAHTITQEFSGLPLDPALVTERQENLEKRLHLEHHLVFVLTVTSDNQKLPFYNEIGLGPLLETLTLRTSNATVYKPVATDGVFDLPVSLSEGRPYKSYVSFPNSDEEGQLLLDTGIALNLQMTVPDNVRPKNSNVIWSHDLLSDPDPPPVTPTPTIDPNQPTPTPSPWANPDVYITILELASEILSQVQQP